MNSHLRRDPFDPDRDFVVTRAGGIKVSGQFLENGAPFEKSLVIARRLRQLYDTRWISMAPLPAEALPGLNVDRMSERQLRLFLEDNGVIPRHGASDVWLRRRVRQFLGEQRAA